MTQTIVNLGTGGAVLNGRNGSTTGADSNDALFLDRDGVNYVYLPGVTGNFLSVPDAAALDITGDIDLRVQVALDDWTPAAPGNLISKFDGGNSYLYWINTNGTISFYWNDGVALRVATSTVATGLTDGSVKWVRATLDVDNGSSGRNIQFFLSDDGAVWTQLGTTVTQATVTSIVTGAASVAIGQGSGTFLAGKVYRAQIYSDLTETNKVLDIDTSVITTGAATTFTALTGQTVTISRSTTGRKAVAVVSPVWLFGTDDFMEVADDDLIDFGASDSFTVVLVTRAWNTYVSNGTLIAKRTSLTTTAPVGWGVRMGSSNLGGGNMVLSDGTNASSVAGYAAPTQGTLAVAALVANAQNSSGQSYINGATGTSSNRTAGSLANSEVLRIGRLSGANTTYADMELLAVAVFRRALTATEITAITTYYQARLS